MQKEWTAGQEEIKITSNHKDKLTEALTNELIESREQHQNAVNGYLMSLEDLEQFQVERFANAHQQFKQTFDIVDAEFTEERSRIMAKYRQDNDELALMLKKISTDLQELTASEGHEWKGQREDEKNRIIEEKQTMRIQMESTIEDLWRQFQAVCSPSKAS